MPWNDQSGGGGGWQGGGGGPWGQRPTGGGGGGGSQPPDLEELLRRGQDRFKQAMPGGVGNFGLLIILGVVLVIWMLTGFYRVLPGEVGVVQRFGAFVGPVRPPGLHYHLPYPIESVQTPNTARVNETEVGMRTTAAVSGRPGGIASRDVPEESLMLTGDENIVDVAFTVFWVIKDAPAYLFNIQNPVGTVKAVAESAMREQIGKGATTKTFEGDEAVGAVAEESILNVGRVEIQEGVRQLMQETLDSYNAGIEISSVNLQKIDPPAAVIDAFRDVQAARADQQRFQNEAEAYFNRVEPEARGQAERIIQEAVAYKEQTVAEARGQAARYLLIYEQYARAPEVTRRRIFLETLEAVFADMEKVIIDDDNGAGVVPYLPLPELKKQQQQTQSGEQ